MGFNFICVPLGNFVAGVAGYPLEIVALDLSEMMPVLMGMLGLGAMRSFEKTKGVAREK
jgi:hypothetical protein